MINFIYKKKKVWNLLDMKLEVLGTKRKWCYTSPNTIKNCQCITNSDLGEVKNDQGKKKR